MLWPITWIIILKPDLQIHPLVHSKVLRCKKRIIWIYYNLGLMFVVLAIISSVITFYSLTQLLRSQNVKHEQSAWKQSSRLVKLICKKKWRWRWKSTTVCCKHPTQFTDWLPASNLTDCTYALLLFLCSLVLLATFKVLSLSVWPPNEVV